MPRSAKAVITVVLWLSSISFVGEQAAAQLSLTLNYQDVTDASGIRFGLHFAPGLPGLFPTQQSRFGAGGAVSDYDRDGDLPAAYLRDRILWMFTT